MKQWFKKHKQKIAIWASIIVVLGGSTAIALVNSVSQQEAEHSPSAVEQVYQVAAIARVSQDFDPESVPAAEDNPGLPNYISEPSDSKSFLPIELLSSSEMLRQAFSGELREAHFNPTRQFVAALTGSDDSSSEDLIIVASYYLSAQEEPLLEAFTEAGVPVTVVSPSSAVIANVGANNYYNPALTGNASGQQYPTTGLGPSWLSIVITMFVFILLFAIAVGWIRYFMMRRTSKSKKMSKQVSEVPNTRFADVAGCDEAIEDMRELVDFLKDPEQFTSVGASIPRGALLVGPPGTGKTLLARAVAGEAGVPFYSAAGSDFVEMYVGVGAKRVRELFENARKHEEGAIIFIDEIDAIGRARVSGATSSGNSEVEATLNAMLVEMDGFQQSKVIVLAATNRADMLDKALTRPGRLDRKIQVPLPDRLGREKILSVHASGRPFAENVDWGLIARRTPGMSGADLSQVVNEACLVAARDKRKNVSNVDLDHAVATVAMGKARTSAVVSEHDRLVTAWHEAGHTLAAMLHPDADKPVSVSIIPRGPAGGVTWMAEGDDIFLTRKRAYARLVVAMGGRAAEEIHLDGEFTSGPHGDLTQATNIAYAMVTQYGMTDAGLMVRHESMLNTGTKLADETADAVERLLADALASARVLLRGNQKLLERIVDGLLEFDTLTHGQLLALADGYTALDLPETPLPPTEYRKPRVITGPKNDSSTFNVGKQVRSKRKSVVGALVAAVRGAKTAYLATRPPRRVTFD